jgi:hypothetical protein
MQSFKSILSAVSPQWWFVLVASAVGITAASAPAFESDESKARRAKLKKQNKLRLLADRISIYGKTVHQQFPTGDVVVSDQDFAEQLRKRPEGVVSALNLLLNEQKVQRAPLNGYWKLNG